MRLDIGRAYFAIGGASPTVGQTRGEIAEPT